MGHISTSDNERAASQAALARAVELAGGQSALARMIGGGVRQADIWRWLNENRQCPPEYASKIERATTEAAQRQADDMREQALVAAQEDDLELARRLLKEAESLQPVKREELRPDVFLDEDCQSH